MENNYLKGYIDNIIHTIKTKGVIAIVENIDSYLSTILTYQERQQLDDSSDPGKRERFAGYMHKTGTTIRKIAYEYKDKREQEIKQNVEGQIVSLILENRELPLDVIEHVEDALEYAELESDIETQNPQKGSKKVQNLKVTLKKWDSRFLRYVENLNKLGLDLNVDSMHKDLCMIAEVNQEEVNTESAPHAIPESKKESKKHMEKEAKENIKLELWFQSQLKSLVRHYHNSKK